MDFRKMTLENRKVGVIIPARQALREVLQEALFAVQREVIEIEDWDDINSDMSDKLFCLACDFIQSELVDIMGEDRMVSSLSESLTKTILRLKSLPEDERRTIRKERGALTELTR